MSVGITDLYLLECIWTSSGISVTSVSTENVVGMLGVSVMIPGVIPGMDSLVVELSEIEIVLESLEDCVCLSDMVRSLFSLISSCDLLFKPDFRVNLYSWWLFSKNYWFLSNPTYLKCWRNLFEIELLLL